MGLFGKRDEGMYGDRSGVEKDTLDDDLQRPGPHFWAEVREALRILPVVERLLLRVADQPFKREGPHRVITGNTNAAPLTNAEGDLINVLAMNGKPASSIFINSVGGGNLQININDEGWMDVADKDAFNNETIMRLHWRVTAGASGTARIRLGWPVGDA